MVRRVIKLQWWWHGASRCYDAPAMTKTLDIAFISDVVCPWCAVGLHALEQALTQFPDVAVTRRVMPFELNPDMGPQGQDIVAYLAAKYRMTPAQIAKAQETVRQRGEQVGFEFRTERRTRTWNTFAAHRLLHWAGLPDAPPGAQWLLKKRLLAAYFTDGLNPADAGVLVDAADAVGLDPIAACVVVESGQYADEVRAAQKHVAAMGISAVPATVFNDWLVLSGGHPVETFRNAIADALA